MAKQEQRRVPRPLSRVIGSMRRAVMRFFIVDGLNKLLLALFAFVAVDFLLDRSFRMDKPQRAIMLAIGAALLLYVFWRYLVRPLFSRLSDDALLLQVEQSQGGLDEGLISALELARMDLGADPNISQGMVHQTIERGVQAGRQIRLSKVFRFRRMRVNLALFILLGLVSVVGAGAVAFLKPGQTWFDRNVLLGDAQWPQDYFLDVLGADDGRLRVPRGDDWQITARVREGYRSLPTEVNLEFRTTAGKRIESMVPGAGGVEFGGEFRNVLEAFEFRLTSKAAETEWIKVELVDRPNLQRLQLIAEAPAYTGAEAGPLPAGAGPYYLLAGTRLIIEGATDKPLSKAALLVGEKRHELEVDGPNFTGELAPDALEAGTYFLDIEDRESMAIPGRDGLVGLGPREPARFKVRVKADRNPRVQVALSGVSGMVVPGVRLPFSGAVSDDFAVGSIELDYEWKQDNSEAEPALGKLDIAGIIGETGQAEVAIDGAVEIGPLDVPINSRLSLQFRATDNDTINGPKVGESNKLLLRVVGEAELRTDLLRREKEQRQILAEMVKKQDILLTETGALAAGSRGVEELDPSQQNRLVALQKSQKLAASNLKPIISRLKGMVQEIVNNRLEEDDGILKERINSKVIEPMIGLQEGVLPNAALALDTARRAMDADERAAAFSAAADAQRAAIRIMNEILAHMVRNEGYQQAVNLLYEIQRAQERMRQMTAKEKERALGEVVREKDDAPPPEEGGGADPEPPGPPKD